MPRRQRFKLYKRVLGTALVVLGLVVWVSGFALHLRPRGRSDVSMVHFEARFIAVVAGGTSVAGGIILLVSAI